jgi:hypothetical protein
MSGDPNNNIETILASIGLKPLMIEKDDENAFSRDLFRIYTPQEYLQSERKKTDEIYRMWETVLLHIPTGLRVEYVTTENYFGDEYTYKLACIFIITHSNKTIGVTDMDYKKQCFITPEGQIPFAEARRTTKMID